MVTMRASRDHHFDDRDNSNDDMNENHDDTSRNDNIQHDPHDQPTDEVNCDDDNDEGDENSSDDGSYWDDSEHDGCDYDHDDPYEDNDDDDDVDQYEVNSDYDPNIDDDDQSFDHEQLTQEVDRMRHHMGYIHYQQEKQRKVIITILSLLLGVLAVNLMVQLRLLAGYHRDGGDEMWERKEMVVNNVDDVGDVKGSVNEDTNLPPEKYAQQSLFAQRQQQKHQTDQWQTSATITNAQTNPTTRIYTHSTLSSKNYRAGGILSDEMLDAYERDGVLVIRNLISPKLLDRLDLASQALIDAEEGKQFGSSDDRDNGGDGNAEKNFTGRAIEMKKKENKKKKKKRGKQFHMVKNGAIFLGVPPPPPSDSTISSTCSSNDGVDTEGGMCISNATTTASTTAAIITAKTTTAGTWSQTANNTIMSSFRDLAMYSKLPRVAASLLRLDELLAGGKENLVAGRRRGRSYKMNRGGEREDEKDSMNGDDEFEVDESVNLRICRDIFLTKDDDPYACGWHVDDTGFWPSIASDPGVNAWVALDDMPWPWSRLSIPKSFTDSTLDNSAQNERDQPFIPVATFALSIGSHRAPWRHDAYRATGSAHTDPPEGFQSALDLIRRRSGSGTCNIQTSDPELYEKLEENKVIYDLKRGDVIFHDRWVFHRTVTADESARHMHGNTPSKGHARTNDDDSNDPRSKKIFRRYSIRYSPGTARVPPGYGVELSVLHNPDNANRTLNEISEIDGPWYPKVWPHVLKQKPIRAGNDVHSTDDNTEEEIHGLGKLAHVKIPMAEKLQAERKKEINRLLATHGGR